MLFIVHGLCDTFLTPLPHLPTFCLFNIISVKQVTKVTYNKHFNLVASVSSAGGHTLITHTHADIQTK